MVPTVGLEPRIADLTRFATLRLNHSATPPLMIVCIDNKNQKKKIRERCPFSRENGKLPFLERNDLLPTLLPTLISVVVNEFRVVSM